MVIVVMGVSGAGKSTIGALLAAALGAEFAEGDDYHPPGNLAKMSQGMALDDSDRRPWLEGMAAEIDQWCRDGRDVVLACSALKQSYRMILSGGRADVRFVYLRGEPELIAGRLAGRRGHFMPQSLLASQFATLEEPADAIVVDVSLIPQAAVAVVLAQLGHD